MHLLMVISTSGNPEVSPELEWVPLNHGDIDKALGLLKDLAMGYKCQVGCDQIRNSSVG